MWADGGAGVISRMITAKYVETLRHFSKQCSVKLDKWLVWLVSYVSYPVTYRLDQLDTVMILNTWLCCQVQYGY